MKKILFLFMAILSYGIAMSQTVVRGTVTSSEDGQPIPFASIVVTGSTAVVTANAEGAYEITLPPNAETLEFSFFGMTTKVVPINGREVIDVVLDPDSFTLEDVVVIGYGTAKKRDVAGSVSSIRSDDIAKAAVDNFQKAIQGRAAGVQVTSSSGTPGGAIEILIRGQRSLSGSTAPLYIIDGVQVSTGSQGTGILTSTDALAGLNPDDIESIDIMKDGASASIYGAQAANGVIFITTKKGKAGKTNISFKTTVGWQDVVSRIPTLNGPQFAELTLLSYKNLYGETGEVYTRKLADYVGRGWGADGFSNAPTYDWYDAVFRTGNTQDYQLSMSGGNEQTQYYIAGGYTNENGTMKHTWFKRATARLNLTHKINKWLEFSTSNSFSNVRQRQTTAIAAANATRSALLIQPTNRIYDDNGEYLGNLEDGYYEHNILQVLDYNKYLGTTNKFTSGNYLNINIFDGLTFKPSVSFDYMEMNEHLFIDPRTRQGKSINGQVQDANARVFTFQTDHVLSYNKTFGNDHRLNATAGFSFISSNRKSSGGTGEGVSNPALQLLSSTAMPTEVFETYTEWKTMGLFARIGYTYKDRYIFSGTIRRDGSSRFGANNRFGTFPSASVAWRMSDEPFMKDFKFINDLKLKASYGVTGSSEIGNFTSRRLYRGQGEYDGKAGIYPNDLGNNELTWEESHSYNAGLSARMFDRLTFEADFYITDTKNLLFDRPIPATTGYTEMIANIAGIRNKGIEFLVSADIIRSANFMWQTNFNISFTKNEVTSLIDGVDVINDYYKVGEAATSDQVYHWAGVNPSDGRPMFYNKDGYITYNPRPEDRIWTKGAHPPIFGGFTNTFVYKGFELSFTFQYQKGARARWSDKVPLLYYDGDANIYRYLYTDHWSEPGDYTWVAKPVLSSLYPSDAYPMTTDSDLMYEKTDFIKLKNVSLSYTLPKKLLSKIHIAGAQVYLQAYNLWTTTTYPGYDPEFTGYDRMVYPQAKTYSVGLKLDF